MSSEDRYEDILRRMAQRKAERDAAPKRELQDELAAVLDGLDVWGKLDKLRTSKALRTHTFGPKALNGLTPTPWVAVVLWQRGSGYHGYRVLTLMGVWALDQAGETLVMIGTKRTPFTAPTYEAEAYQKLIKRDFNVYYKDDGAPPLTTNRFYSTIYDPARRLDIREEVRTALAGWAGRA